MPLSGLLFTLRFALQLMTYLRPLTNGSHGGLKRPPLPSLIIGLQKRGVKGRLLLFLFHLASERPSNEPTLQALKVHSGSVFG